MSDRRSHEKKRPTTKAQPQNDREFMDFPESDPFMEGVDDLKVPSALPERRRAPQKHERRAATGEPKKKPEVDSGVHRRRRGPSYFTVLAAGMVGCALGIAGATYVLSDDATPLDLRAISAGRRTTLPGQDALLEARKNKAKSFFDAALGHYDEFLATYRSHPAYQDAIGEYAQIQVTRGEWEKALDQLEQVLINEERPLQATNLLLLRGRAYDGLNQTSRAISNLERAFELAKLHELEEKAYEAGIALSYALEGQSPREALKVVEELEQLLPKTDTRLPEMTFKRAEIMQRLGLDDQAAAAFRSVQEAVGPESPLYSEAENALARASR